MENYFDNTLEQISAYLPGVLGALLVLLVGWLVARLLARLAGRLVHTTGLQDRFARDPNTPTFDLGETIRKFVFYILMALVLIIVLDLLGVGNVLDPLKEMTARFLGFLPNIIAALAIGFLGYIAAKVISELVGLASNGIERLGTRLGFTGDVDLTQLLKQVVFFLIFIPILITAFDTLQMRAISEPATAMLYDVIEAIPNVLAAAVILIVFYFIGKYVSQLVVTVLDNIGIDRFAERTGLNRILGTLSADDTNDLNTLPPDPRPITPTPLEDPLVPDTGEPVPAGSSLSRFIGGVVFFFILFSGVVTAIEKLNFLQLSALVREMFEITLQIFFGLIILLIGNWIATIAYRYISRNRDNEFLASIARVAVIGLFLAIALRSMGIANDIVNLAFGLTLGAIAVAVALSFGLGGREAAGKQMEYILRKFRREDRSDDNPPVPPSSFR